MKKLYILLLSIAVIYCNLTSGQTAPNLASIATEESSIEWLNIKPKVEISTDKFFNVFKQIAGLTKGDEFISLRQETDALGNVHAKYEQYYKGLKVEGAQYILHSQNNTVTKANGKIVTGLKIAVVPAIKEQEALGTAFKMMGEQKFAWQDSNQVNIWVHNQHKKIADLYPKGKLVIVCKQTDFSASPEDFVLAWRFDIWTAKNVNSRAIYVDANTNTVIKAMPLTSNCSSGTGQTIWHGTQSINTTYSSSYYRLNEQCYVHGDVHTVDYYYAWNYDYTNSTNTWGSGTREGVEAHRNSRIALDFYWSYFGRNSYNNAGGILNVYNEDFTDPNNAHWDATNGIYLGNGGSSSATDDWCTSDIVGHEITHAVTQFSAGLIYSYESGALNEAVSDIFGESIEHYYLGYCDWLMGAERGTPIRSFSNPNSHGQPDTYHGAYWYTGSADAGGVHTNSGVFNYFYYLLVNGGSGINDNGYSYSCTGIGFNNAQSIIYRALTVYLSPSSVYGDAKIATLQAATDLFGPSSAQYNAVVAAWCAVGLGTTCSTGCTLTSLTPSIVSPGTSSYPGSALSTLTPTISWASVPGATNYTLSISQYPFGSLYLVFSLCVSGTSYTLPSGYLVPGVYYRWNLQANTGCSSCVSSFSSPLYFNTFSSGPCTTPAWYSESSMLSGFGMNSFYLGGYSGSYLSQSGIISASNPTTGYLDATGMAPVTLQQGGSYSGTVTYGTSSTYMETQMWIDFNDNGTFEASEVVSPVAGFSTTTSSSSTGISANIPTTAPTGIHKVRVRCIWMQISTYTGLTSSPMDPCAMSDAQVSYWSGTVTDYKANIVSCSLPTVGPISGSSTICTGSSTTLTDGTFGGTWSSSLPGVATVSSGGLVTGISTGTVVISYSVSNSCGSASATMVVNINATPSAGMITGSGAACVGTTTTLYDASPGGTWSSVSPGVATISTGGIVNGISAGTSLIDYTVSNSCGTAIATTIVSVNPMPFAGSISGSSTVCAGSNITLVDGAIGGVWSSASPGIATVSSSGIVTGISGGTSDISYSVSNSCGTVAATKTITVNPLPNAGSITGIGTVCTGSTTILYDASSGGLWSSASPGIATVSSGIVSGVSVGTSVISYTVTNSCGTAAATAVVTVNLLPFAGSITGPSTVCEGSNITLVDGTSGGTWSSTSAGIATVSSGGVVIGVSAGVAIISYTVSNTCGIIAATKTVTVNPIPNAGSITGVGVVCIGATTTLYDTNPGGLWSSVNPGVATVNSSGVVSGVSLGTSVISYTISNSCGVSVATAMITVNPLPNAGVITGSSTVCVGSNITLADATAGGMWSSASPWIASIDGGGIVTGMSAGTSIVSYTVANSCGTASATKIVTIDPIPYSGSITGAGIICTGTTTALYDASPGGTWSSVNPGVATISSGGIVTGVTTGTSVISYTVSNSCGVSVATKIVTVNLSPIAGSIIGAGAMCLGSTTTFIDAASGGVWSSTFPWIASIDGGGVVSGMSAGTSVISYTVSNSCGSVSATRIITVDPMPNAGSITGIATLCTGSTVTLYDATPGGTWSSASTGVATITTGGIVTGISAGMAVISYLVTNSCGSAVATMPITVNLSPNAGIITGTTNICVGSTTTFSDTAVGGLWSSASTGIATVSSSGVVTGVSVGICVISYTVSNTCGTIAAIKTVTVEPVPIAGTITGLGTVCAGSTTILYDITPGGVWSSTSPAIATISSGGVVSGVSSGTSVISYTVTNSCGIAAAVNIVTVNPIPSIGTISGASNICVGQIDTMTCTIPGGVWNATNTNALVSSIGEVFGMVSGIDTITYLVTNACGSSTSTHTVTINPAPSGGTISGPLSVCEGANITLTVSVAGGIWNASNSRAFVSSGGMVHGLTAGIDTIRYTIVNSCGTGVSNHIINVETIPNAGTITGHDSLCIGSITSLSDVVTGGIWISTDPSIASVSSGVVTGISSGIDTIKYSVSNSCGNAASTFPVVVYHSVECDVANYVNPVTSKYELIKIYPNPTNGIVNVEIPVIYKKAEIVVTDITGKVIDKRTVIENNRDPIQFNLIKVSKGIYFVKIITDETSYVNKLIVE